MPNIILIFYPRLETSVAPLEIHSICQGLEPQLNGVHSFLSTFFLVQLHFDSKSLSRGSDNAYGTIPISVLLIIPHESQRCLLCTCYLYLSLKALPIPPPALPLLSLPCIFSSLLKHGYVEDKEQTLDGDKHIGHSSMRDDRRMK